MIGPVLLASALVGQADRPADTLATRVVYQAEGFSSPVALALADDYFVALTPYSRPAVHVIDRRSGTLAGTIGGPAQGGFLRSVAVARDTVWIADTGRREIVGIAVQDLVRAPVWEDLPSIPVPHRFSELVAVTPDGFLLASPNGSGAHFVLDRAGSVASSHLDARQPGSDLPRFGIRPFMEHMAVTSEDGTYVAAGHWSDAVAAYRGGGTALRRLRDAAFEPDFVGEQGSRVVPGPAARVAYLDVAAAESNVFALYSGAPHYGGAEGAAAAGGEIHVFDESGQQTSLAIDRPLRHLAAADRSGRLYGLTWDEPASIVEIVLPTTRTGGR